MHDMQRVFISIVNVYQTLLFLIMLRVEFDCDLMLNFDSMPG